MWENKRNAKQLVPDDQSCRGQSFLLGLVHKKDAR